MSLQAAKNHILDTPEKLTDIVHEAINGDSNQWLVDAIVHSFSTGDWLYTTAQIKRHIEPDIDTEASALATKWALEKERDRAEAESERREADREHFGP